jgi:hypothetical protein
MLGGWKIVGEYHVQDRKVRFGYDIACHWSGVSSGFRSKLTGLAAGQKGNAATAAPDGHGPKRVGVERGIYAVHGS